MVWKFCPRICGKLGTLILALTGVIKSRAGIPVKTFLVTERNKQTKKELTRNVTPNITDNLYFQNVNKINSAYAEPSSPSGRRLAPVSLYNLRSIFFFPGGGSFSRREKITNVWFALSFCSMNRLGVFLLPPGKREKPWERGWGLPSAFN